MQKEHEELPTQYEDSLIALLNKFIKIAVK